MPQPFNQDDAGHQPAMQMAQNAPDERFDILLRLARRHFAVDAALLTLHAGPHQYLQACAGLPLTQNTGASRLETAAPLYRGILVVNDRLLEEDCHEHPLAIEYPHFRFYARCPLEASNGELPGALWLLDAQPRELDAAQREFLRELARLAAIDLERDQLEHSLRREADALRESEKRMALAITGSGTGIWDRDIAADEIHYSAGWKAILGYAEHEVSTRIEDSYQRVHPDDLAQVQAAIQAHFTRQTPNYSVEHRLRCRDGSYKWVSSRGQVVSRDAQGRPLRMIGTTTDISERKRIEAELVELASTDHLTLLPNRRHFMSHLATELARIQRGNAPAAAVLMCDLDHFKGINDHWGHAIGDLALAHFGQILREQLRKTDLAGRVGGEEFAIVLGATDLAAALRFARRVQQLLAEQPLRLDQQRLALTVSIGITAMTAGDENIDSPLSRSDQALYRAKENGRNRIESLL